jgi:hypothetical protein
MPRSTDVVGCVCTILRAHACRSHGRSGKQPRGPPRSRTSPRTMWISRVGGCGCAARARRNRVGVRSAIGEPARSPDMSASSATFQAIRRSRMPGPGISRVADRSRLRRYARRSSAADLTNDPYVRPTSLTAWVGVGVMRTTRRIEAVAMALGVRSLDAAARIIGWDWTTDTRPGRDG